MKRILLIGVILISLLALTIPSYIYLRKTFFAPSITSENNTPENKEPEPPLEETILNRMTTEEKVGQLFMVGIDGTTLTEETKSFLTEHHMGSVILYAKNVSTQVQIALLTQEIQTTNDIPLFISIDQEGGIVARLKWNDTLTIAQEDIKTPQQAYTVAKNRGEILKELGINMNLAPVVEYITDKNSFLYNRAFRGSKDDVAQKGISSIQGYQDSGIIAVLKHYPGHANLSPDSHYSLPIVNITAKQWDEYIQPFSRILKQTNVDGIMVGHIMYPNIDNHPATLSKEIISNRLTTDLQYEGLVISDDMGMDALDNQGTIPEVAKQAIEAGNDILIYTTADTLIQKQVYDYILQEVSNGNMNIDEKVLKILREKITYGIITTSY